MKLPKRWNIKPLNFIPDDYSRWWKAGQLSKGTAYTRQSRILLVYNTNSISSAIPTTPYLPWQEQTLTNKDKKHLTWKSPLWIKFGRNIQPTFFNMGSPNWKLGRIQKGIEPHHRSVCNVEVDTLLRLSTTLGPSELCTIKRFLYYSGGVRKEMLNCTANSS